MKEIQAWKTTDGKVFFEKKEAVEHEETLRHETALQNLTVLFCKYDDPDAAAGMALHVLQNVREFAMAISPLITKGGPKSRKGLSSIDHEMRDV